MSRRPWELPPGHAELLNQTGVPARPDLSGRRDSGPRKGQIQSATQHVESKARSQTPGFHSATQQLAGADDLKEVIERFRIENMIVSFFEERLGVGALKRAAVTNGGEWEGPCPVCGGEDRLRVWPNPPQGHPRAWCRKCERSGDALDWAAWISGRDPKVKGAIVETLRALGKLPQPEPRTVRPPHSTPVRSAEHARSEPDSEPKPQSDIDASPVIDAPLDQSSEATVIHMEIVDDRELSRPDVICMSCWSSKFVRLKNGRRSVCAKCEQPDPDDIAGPDVGLVGGPL